MTTGVVARTAVADVAVECGGEAGGEPPAVCSTMASTATGGKTGPRGWVGRLDRCYEERVGLVPSGICEPRGALPPLPGASPPPAQLCLATRLGSTGASPSNTRWPA